LRRHLSKKGIKFLTQTELDQIKIKESSVKTTVKKNDGKTETLQSEKVLLAMGRKPETENSGLEALNLEFNGRFIDVDENMQTSQTGIYAIGDISGRPLLAHVASAQGLFVAHNIAGVDYPPINDNTIPKVTYTNPQVASVGMTQEEAELADYDLKVARFPFISNGKAQTIGEEEGFIKVITDKSGGEILGVHLIGHEVGELIGGMSLAMNLEATNLEVSANIFPHPTISEVFSEVFHMIEGKAIHI
jgi:dihydrolipoamide dehydrogenase